MQICQSFFCNVRRNKNKIKLFRKQLTILLNGNTKEQSKINKNYFS